MAYPLQVIGFKVRSLDVDYHELSWELADTQVDVLDYSFQVFRSESSNGPWEAISVPFTDRYVFVDRITHPFHAARLFHYLLRVKNNLTGETYDVGYVNLQPDADLIARELRRHMNLLFREFTGRRCWVLPVRTFGQRCTCWNPVLQKRTRSGCRLCYDTGFVRGYHYPIETWIQIDPGSNLAEQTTNVGALQQMNTTARVSDVGIVKPRDVIVEPENKRWRVTQINQTEQGRSPIHLELTLHQIPPSDIEYAIELKLDQPLRDLALSPARNFTNPHNLESFGQEEIPKIFSLYGSTYPDPHK
jgi:hypothetical protein